MDISFDPSKNERNIAARGIPFEQAAAFEWNSALIVEDTRKDQSSQSEPARDKAV